MIRGGLIVLLWFSSYAFAGSKFYHLSPDFYGINTVEFVLEANRRGQVIKAFLIDEGGTRHSVPDVCESEGGAAELSDVYTVKGKKTYFLFTCTWSVQHAGIGLKGVQYETFVYVRNGKGLIVKERELSKTLSAYEGSLEGGDRVYAWYPTRKISGEKLLELEAGKSVDSIFLAHGIVLLRLNDGDIDAVKSYLSFERIQQMIRDFPINRSTVTAYNDFGFALGRAGEEAMAYEVLKKVEKFSPFRMVLKLNIAEVLWQSDKEASKAYYKEYIGLMRAAGKEKLIPAGVFERIDSN